ncbi:MAG: glycosyltransferase family 4 protein [Bacteroidetes bacterium]|nr:glycosyltransferase family 4 protein [Bacteroidota bacterium]
MLEKPSFRLAYLIGSSGWGGLEMNQIHNAEWMRARGHEVLILCVKNSPASAYLAKKNTPHLLIPKHRNHFDLWRAFSLWRLLKRAQIQHLIVRSVFDMSIAASVCFFSRKKIKAHYFMEMQLSSNKKQWFRTMRYRYFSSWNSPLAYMKEQVEQHTHMPHERIHLIPSAVNDAFYERPNQQQLRKELGLPEQQLLIGLFGRIDRKKNQLIALKALCEMNEPNLTLLIIGQETPDDPQEYLSELQAFIKTHRLGSFVKFTGHVEDVSAYMHAVDACLITSSNESVGMVTLEALAADKTVIGTNSGGTKELLGSGYGFLFDPNDSSHLASILSGLNNESHVPLGMHVSEMDKNRSEAVCEQVENLLLLSSRIA